jgi:DNA replication protein DnaC
MQGKREKPKSRKEKETMLEAINKNVFVYDKTGNCDSEGFLICEKCNTRKELDIEIPELFSGKRRVRMMCACESKEYDAMMKYNQKRQTNREVQAQSFISKAYSGYRFEHDDGRNEAASVVCQKYVADWDAAFAENRGILFYGGIGTGKSFLASCIANALMEKGVPVCVTSFPQILAKEAPSVGELSKFKLLIIDDLGVERNTTYAAEIIFSVIDARLQSKMPLIVTTNLMIEEFDKPGSVTQARIYDRIMDMCGLKIMLNGKSGRKSQPPSLKAYRLLK